MNLVIKRIQGLVAVFCRITVLVLIVSAIYIGVFWGVDTGLEVRLLWQILGVSLLCTLGEFLIPLGEGKEVSKKSMLVRMILYFLYVNVVVLGFGLGFEWFFVSSWKMILGMEICIIAVYAAVLGLSYLAEYKVAEEMNKKLRERGE